MAEAGRRRKEFVPDLFEGAWLSYLRSDDQGKFKYWSRVP